MWPPGLLQEGLQVKNTRKSHVSHRALEECAILALWVYFSAGSAQPSQLALYRTIGQGQP